MKHIKTFEVCTDKERLMYDDCNDSWYWKITNKYPDILIIFDKIGIPTKEFTWLWSEDNHLIKDYYIFKTEYENGKFGWSYSGLDYHNPDYRKPPKYMGEVEITDEDRKKWEIKINAKKYNL